MFISCDVKILAIPLRCRVAIVKPGEAALESTKSIASQVQVITLSNEISGSEDLELSFLHPLQRYAQQVYNPVVRLSSSSELVC